MGLRTLLLPTAMLACFAATACGETAEEAPPEEETPAAPVTITGSAVTFEDGAPPLAGLKVCVQGQPEASCVLSDAEGRYTIAEAPGQAQLVLTMTRDEYYPYRRYVTTGTAPLDLGEFVHFTVNELAMLVAFAPDQHLDEALGNLIFLAYEHDAEGKLVGLGGVTYSVQPASGTVLYVSESGFPSEELTATGADGLGGIVNVTPGAVSLRFSHPDRTCLPDPASSWSLDADGGLPSTVMAGQATVAGGVICDP